MNFGLGEFYATACALAWAVAVILYKRSGESLPPLPLNLFKNLVGFALMLVTVLVVSGPQWPGLSGMALGLALLSGFLGIGVGDTLYFRALNAIGASRMGIAQTLYSPSVIGLSALYLGERLVAWQWAGVVLVLAGIALVNFNPGLAAIDAARLRRGAINAGASVFVMALGVVLAKPLLEQYDFFWIVMLRILGGLIGLLPFMAWKTDGANAWSAFRHVRHWPHVIAGSIVGNYLSMMLWLAGYKYTTASIASVLNELAAVFIMLLAWLFLKERLRPRQLVGGALAISGVLLVVTAAAA